MKNTSLNKKAKALQKAFGDEEFILKILQTCGKITNKTDFREKFAQIFKYYLCTEDKKHNYSFGEIQDKINELYAQGQIMIDQRYYFQAYNGCSEETYNTNGLDDISELNPKIVEAFELLESKLGKTTQGVGGEVNGTHRSYITTDPEMLMRYALDFSPERLWYGPLNEVGASVSFGNPIKTSIRVGEKKTDYIMRIIEGKIEGMPEDEKIEIRKAARIIADAYGSKRPRIAIIPESEIKDYKADYNSFASNVTEPPDTTILDLANAENPEWVYTLESGSNFRYEGGIVVYEKITPDKFESISIPDSYELLQMYAIQRGANYGDLIDPYTGAIRERAKNQSLAKTQKIKMILNKIITRINGKEKSKGAKEEKYEDLRTNTFGWYR